VCVLVIPEKAAISKTTVQIHKRLAWQAWIHVTKSNPSTLFVTVVASSEQLFDKINGRMFYPSGPTGLWVALGTRIRT
jgi:hypothetical protein